MSDHLTVFHCVIDWLNVMNAYSLPLAGTCNQTVWLAEACEIPFLNPVKLRTLCASLEH